ncbi:hypothetical protein [Rivibacter subsaxonicus]|uniref:Uncharacterized protein n=1 Tax=Rivibacter subsaxonicus TaxID=457575 RepID=A0A4V2FUL3_9BURK|nr:hypothetical protein [Rivibacter subsaxonicus]RZU02486.1 hypothetical protein EV670_0510 [Rivibacter subsaxonicus]
MRTAMTRKLLALALLPLLLLPAGCDFFQRAPEVPFAPYGEAAQARMDLAEVEYRYPLGPADLAKITPDNLAKLDQEQIDQIYARLSAGPIPDGPYDGKILLPRGSSGKFRVAEIVGGLGGLIVHLKGLELETVGEQLWRGKVFFRDQRVLRNRIEDLGLLQKLGLVEGEPQKFEAGGRQTWLLFPAKLYCGQSLFDSRRESVIIDYFFSDEIAGYQEKPDFLAGRRGLVVRDEIRMVRPGFYLGRAYLNRAFGLNFTLYNAAIAERDGPAFLHTGSAEDCWSGTQRRLTAGSRALGPNEAR